MDAVVMALLTPLEGNKSWFNGSRARGNGNNFAWRCKTWQTCLVKKWNETRCPNEMKLSSNWKIYYEKIKVDQIFVTHSSLGGVVVVWR